MELHPLAARFDAVAGNYERGRPDYPPAVVGALMAELGLNPGDQVIDLAAGTGKLTRALLAEGLDVVGVEPQDAMRRILAETVGPDRAIAGVAEAIPVAEASQRAVTVADGFHWFDAPRALADIARVLVPGGGLALFATYPEWTGASWAHELGSLLSEMRPEHPYFDGPSWAEAVAAAGGWEPLIEFEVKMNRPARAEAMGDYLMSMSWVAALENDARAEMIERAETFVREGETPEELPIHYRVGFTTRAL